MRTIIAVLFLALGSCAAFGQSPQPGPLTVVFDGQPSGCAVYLVSCVSQVNGVQVCPYGRVAWYPLPGQPYTAMTYPKVDQSGNPINMFQCVSTLPLQKPWTDPNFLNGSLIWY